MISVQAIAPCSPTNAGEMKTKGIQEPSDVTRITFGTFALTESIILLIYKPIPFLLLIKNKYPYIKETTIQASYSNTCTHIFDINTGTLELLYDYRKENTANEFYNTNFVTDEIYVLRKGSKKVIVNRKTGEEIDTAAIFE